MRPDMQNEVSHIKKGYARQVVIGLRDYYDFAKMILLSHLETRTKESS